MTDETSPADDDTPALPELPAPEGATPNLPAAARGARAPLLLAVVACLLALVAAGAAALLWFREPAEISTEVADDPRIGQLEQQLADTRERLATASAALESIRTDTASLGRRQDSYERTLDERSGTLASVPGRLSAVESSLAALQGISAGVRDAWLLAEAEYYLQIANAKLDLAGDPQLALIALKLADERIAQLADPSLVDVRRALADELRELAGLETPDVEGIALTLGSLAGAVETLPLRTDLDVPERDSTAVDDQLSGMDRALASLKSAFSKAVSVRRTDQPLKPLLPPDAVYFLRSNLALQLQAARLALLRGDAALFQQSLDDAARWLAEYYDGERTPVKSAIDTIDELRNTQFSDSWPDISQSLTLLRRYRTLNEESMPPASGDGDDAQ